MAPTHIRYNWDQEHVTDTQTYKHSKHNIHPEAQ